MAWGMHGSEMGGHVWQGAGGACVAGGCAWQILRDTVNERVVRILLECIPVINAFKTILRFFKEYLLCWPRMNFRDMTK